LALAAIYVGATRSDAAKIGGAELQIIWEWVFALQGLRAPDGLLNGNAPGQPAKLNDNRCQSIARTSKAARSR
jgi:hypothetical protein